MKLPIGVLTAALLCMLTPPTLFAGIELFSPVYGSGSATVTSSAYYDAISSEWVYEYQISNATINFSFFSVAINPGASITDYGWYAGAGDPLAWEPVNNPPQSIEAFFKDPIGPTEMSSILWFTSPNEPTEGIGSLAGMSGGQYSSFAVGTVLTPIPEPATFMLLATGAAACFVGRSRKNR